MRRNILVLLVVGLALGALAPAQAAKKKKPKPKPAAAVPVDVVYNVVWSDETCALSVETTLVNPDTSCGDPFAGTTTGALAGSGEPIVIAAIDGLPLTLDASKPIKGTVKVGSYTLAALAQNGLGQPLGAGEAEWHVVVAGTSGGAEVTVGEVTTEPYLVVPGPASGSYEVAFEIAPSADLAGKVLDSLSVSFEQVGSATLHGALQTEESTVTLGAFAVPK